MKNQNQKQEKKISSCIEWLTSVTNKQGRILDSITLWNGYPFKRTGLTKEGFIYVLGLFTESVNKIK